jgi:glutaredoxin
MLAGAKMLSELKEKLRAFAYQKLQSDGGGKMHPVAQHVRNLASIVNELLGQPIHGARQPAPPPAPPRNDVAAAPARPATLGQAPVVVYFDGKDHRTKAKVEELLRGRQIVFQVLDVTDDEAERSWVTTTSKLSEFPIVVIAGTPVGGLGELTQLDLEGELVRRVFVAT